MTLLPSTCTNHFVIDDDNRAHQLRSIGNHSVTQSTFAKPCTPLAAGINSGFNAANGFKGGFQMTVKNGSVPMWFYCAQTL